MANCSVLSALFSTYVDKTTTFILKSFNTKTRYALEINSLAWTGPQKMAG
jgi:hypothetical protein